MKKNNIFTAYALRLQEWLHQWIEKKAEQLDDCGWYPGPCQTQYPF